MKLTPAAFRLLDDLAENNERAWYKAHQEQIEARLLDPFGEVLAAVSDRLAKKKIRLAGGPDTMFRMNRDVRFSKDKRPYKENVSGLLTRDGTKKSSGTILYFQCEAGGGFLAFGTYMPSTDTLNRVRQRVIEKAGDFAKVRRALDKYGHGFADLGRLKRMPRGFEAHEAHDHAEVLKHKSLIVRVDLPKKAWLTGDVVERAVGLATDTKELGKFLDAALAGYDA